MLGKEMNQAVDFKKITILEIELALEEIREQVEEGLQPRLKILTASGFIEATIATTLQTNQTKEPLLSQILTNYEFAPKIDVSEKEIINITACVYLENVIFTPFATSAPIKMDELILFTDHILGITLA
ncbi:MAG: hypothetical protein ACI35O_06170 [Bacillaceae bacterium]